MSSTPTYEPLQRILRTSGVPDDAVLIVHSAIKGLGRAGYRAEPMIDCMLEHLKHGTLLMPAMTWRTVTPQSPLWDELATPSHTGVLTEIFRTQYATARSLHPTHSVAGVGALANTLLSHHHCGNTPVPATSPYGLMRDYPAYILMLGVGLESCTAIHHPAEIVAPDIYVKPAAQAEEYTLRDRNGRSIAFHLRRHQRLNRDFPKFGPLLAAQSKFLSGTISSVPWSIVRASDLLREVFARLIEQPDFNISRS